MNNNKILINLRKLRKSNNFSQDDLAKAIEINQQTYGIYELGKRELPVRLAKKIGQIFKVNWWELYEEEG